MNTIWKYELPEAWSGSYVISVPEKSYLLSLQVQKGTLCLWFLVDTDSVTYDISLRCYGTGLPITKDPSKLEHIGSYQLAGGSFVGHVFVEKE